MRPTILLPISLATVCMVATSDRLGAATGPSAERHPPKETTYTLTSVLQILKPCNPEVMNDDFQDVRVLSQDQDSYTLEVTYYPLHQPAIGENPDWRKDYAAMTEYLKPTPTENWDEAMRGDLVTELRQGGIDPDRLTDKQLVEQVSRWAMNRAHSTDSFAVWDVYFPDGKPSVYPALREAFERQKPDKTWPDEKMFEQEVLGRSMFYNKIHGSCTSSSVYLATVLRALGLPTRIVFCIPPFDPNDDAQARLFYENVRHHKTRETVRAALDGSGGFQNHLFNEVYVGHRWVRLNYSTLGQPVLDAAYFGLLTHIYTCTNLSDAPLAQTWGMRYARYPADQPKLSSVNPYRLISVVDHFGADAHLENPDVPVAELRTVTIIGLYPKGSLEIPKWFKDDEWQKVGTDFLIAGREWLSGAAYHQMRAFEKRAGHEFLLTAPGQPTIRAHLNRLCLSEGDGQFQAYGAQFSSEDKTNLVRGIGYSIEPLNTNDTYRWAVAPGVSFRADVAVEPAALTAKSVEPPAIFHNDARILFQGDSITDGNRGRNEDPNHILGHGYAFIIAAKYGAAFPERNLTFINRGISGNKVTDLEKRWQQDTLDLKPDVLSILIGVNDNPSVPLDQYEQIYDKLLNDVKVQNPGIHLVLGEPFTLPVGAVNANWDTWSKGIKQRQKIVARLAQKHHAALLRFQSLFDATCRKAPAEHWIWDGIHPTYSGHQLMADEWVRAVEEFWPNPK